ncbi:MAG: type II secretion system protein [bacterium]|nr:type II secretion system protein [bacterium]
MKNKTKGFGLLEIVVAISIISFSLFSVMSAVIMALRVSEGSEKNIQAAYLLEEGVEVLRILRDTSWQNNIANITTGVNYYFIFNNNAWQATTSATNLIDQTFERKFVLENVYRNGNDDIAQSGSLDNGTKKATVTVSWFTQKGTTTQNTAIYLTNIFSD